MRVLNRGPRAPPAFLRKQLALFKRAKDRAAGERYPLSSRLYVQRSGSLWTGAETQEMLD
jgi:hypothetical protein